MLLKLAVGCLGVAAFVIGSAAVPGQAVNAAPSRCWYVEEGEPSHKGKACDVSRTVSADEGVTYHVQNDAGAFSVKFLETDATHSCGDSCEFAALWKNGDLWESTYAVDRDGAMRLWLEPTDSSPQFIFRIPENLSASRPASRPVGLRRGQLSETPFQF